MTRSKTTLPSGGYVTLAEYFNTLGLSVHLCEASASKATLQSDEKMKKRCQLRAWLSAWHQICVQYLLDVNHDSYYKGDFSNKAN